MAVVRINLLMNAKICLHLLFFSFATPSRQHCKWKSSVPPPMQFNPGLYFINGKTTEPLVWTEWGFFTGEKLLHLQAHIKCVINNNYKNTKHLQGRISCWLRESFVCSKMSNKTTCQQMARRRVLSTVNLLSFIIFGTFYVYFSFFNLMKTRQI